MPLDGDSNFKTLKKNYSKGKELKGKTMGIIGFGRIGQETAKIALGIGMNVLFTDKFVGKTQIDLNLAFDKKISFDLESSDMTDLLKNSDFVSLHVAARGGVVDEKSLIESLDSGKLAFAGVDTFENEPKPSVKLLMHPKVSLTPHIGAATNEAQDRIGIELANQIMILVKE